MSNKNKTISARARFSGLLAFLLAALLTPAGKIIATAGAGAAIIGGLSLAPQKPVTQKVVLQEPKPQILPLAMPPLNDAQDTLTVETDSGPLALVLGDNAEPPTGGAPGLSPGPDPSGPGLPQGTRPGPGAPDLPSGPNGCVPGVDCPPPGPPGPQIPPPEDPSPQNPKDGPPTEPPEGKSPHACTPGVDCTKGKPDEPKSESCTPGIDCQENDHGPEPTPQPCKPGACPPQVGPACPPGVDCENTPPGCNPGVDCVPEGVLPCMPGVDCDLSCAPGEVCIPASELLPVAGAEEPDLPATEASRTAAIPEPATFALVILGLFALAWMLRRKPAMQPKPD